VIQRADAKEESLAIPARVRETVDTRSAREDIHRTRCP
jgi:hypothetical protein